MGSAMPGFTKGWARRDGDKGGGRGLGDLFKTQVPVKTQIERANREVALLVARLNQAEARVKARDQDMFRRVVGAVRRGDSDRAAIFANELAQIRKLWTTVSGAKLALEQVSMRLSTVSDMGDVAAALAPTIGVIRGVGGTLATVVPNAQGEIDEIAGLLSSTLVEAGTAGGASLNFQAANSEAEQVLAEAAALASERAMGEFPEVPATIVRNEEEEGLAI